MPLPISNRGDLIFQRSVSLEILCSFEKGISSLQPKDCIADAVGILRAILGMTEKSDKCIEIWWVAEIYSTAAKESNKTEIDSPKWSLRIHSAKIGETSMTVNFSLCFAMRSLPMG